MRLYELKITPGVHIAFKRMLDGADSFAIQDVYDGMDDHYLPDDSEADLFRLLIPDIVGWFERCVKARADGDTMQHIEYMVHLITEVGIDELRPHAVRVLNDNKDAMIMGLLHMVKDTEFIYVSEVLMELQELGIGWPELGPISRSMRAEEKKTRT